LGGGAEGGGVFGLALLSSFCGILNKTIQQRNNEICQFL
jgi:hypothetical protein